MTLYEIRFMYLWLKYFVTIHNEANTGATLKKVHIQYAFQYLAIYLGIISHYVEYVQFYPRHLKQNSMLHYLQIICLHPSS